MPRGNGTLTDGEKRAALRMHFDQFWKAYPRKVGINEAERSYCAAVYGTETRPGVDPVMLNEKARAYAENLDPNDVKYAPYPAKWITDGHYEDSDLFTDQREQELIWLRGCYKRCDVEAVEKRLGVTYPYKPLPPGMVDPDDIKRWHKAQVRSWITDMREKLSSE